MRGLALALSVLAGLVISILVYLATGGMFVFLFLPLLFCLRLIGRVRTSKHDPKPDGPDQDRPLRIVRNVTE